MDVKKGYAVVAIFFIILYAIAMEKSPFSGVQATYSERYDNFDEAFLQRFKGQNDIWLVLGNRGVTNYYRERFSKNWIFWDYHSSSDSVGISGDFLNPKNWKQVSKMLPRKVDYIAVDFNDLVSCSKRNQIIQASKDVLKADGMFCIEDDYDNRKKQFKHFTEEDLDQLSQDFYIEYAYWDGYISALPYTSDQSANKKTDMYKGLEMMILRLASANAEEKKRILPYITPNLLVRSFLIKKPLTKRLVRDIIDSSQLRQLIRRYEDALKEEEKVAQFVEKEQKEIESIKKDIENYTKMLNLSGSISKGFQALSKNINAFYKGVSNFAESRRKRQFSAMDKVTKFMNENSGSSKGFQEQLDEAKGKFSDHEIILAGYQGQLKMVKEEVKDLTAKIIKYNDEIFDQFERDKYLRPYVAYKKTELSEIIEDSKDADEDFWDEFDSFWSSISETEVLAKELEKSWSPDIIIQNLVPIEKIRSDAEQKISDTSRILILFTKK